MKSLKKLLKEANIVNNPRAAKVHAAVMEYYKTMDAMDPEAERDERGDPTHEDYRKAEQNVANFAKTVLTKSVQGGLSEDEVEDFVWDVLTLLS